MRSPDELILYALKRRSTIAITAFLAALTLTGCNNTDSSSSEAQTVVRSGTVSEKATSSNDDNNDEELNEPRFDLPKTPITVSDGSGQTIIKGMNCGAIVDSGTVHLKLHFGLDSKNNNAKSFDYKLTDRSGNVASSGTVETKGEPWGDEIIVRVDIEDLYSPEIYTLTIEDHAQG